MSRGAFIVLEGLDRSGKSTQCRRLVEHFKKLGSSVRFQPYPDRTEPETGPKIDEFLKNAQSPYERAKWIHDLFSTNRRNLDSKLRDDISAGMTVIADRYSFSGIAYSAAKNHPDLSFEEACKTELDLLKPDLVIYLRADVGTTSTRADHGKEVLEKAEFQEKVRHQMERLVNEQFWEVVEATQTIDEVFREVLEKVQNKLEFGLGSLSNFELSDFNLS
ncbi:Thymidylate kinase [Aphelenchoides besseyi]|nr:Thymidylate kinase [Aphelenchoides besseyi]KAI6194157.1 Thymidylate kinase [Aphelenchoides besseyi]